MARKCLSAKLKEVTKEMAVDDTDASQHRKRKRDDQLCTLSDNKYNDSNNKVDTKCKNYECR